MAINQVSLQQHILRPTEAAQTFRTPRQTHYDLIVIGGGSAGLSAAELGAALGAQVALLDREKLGGECLYTGCVPSKALLHVAKVAASTRTAGKLGLDATAGPVDLGAVADHIQRVIDRVYEESDTPEHLRAEGVDVVFGEPQFLSPDHLSINGQVLSARRFIICTGSRPTVPPIPGLAQAGFLTNETVFSLRTLPEHLIVIGAGPIGCEISQAFARFGARVTLVEALERILLKDEPEAAAILRKRLETEGVTIYTQAKVTGVERRGGQKAIQASTPDGPMELAADALLVAVGRLPNVDGLHLEAAGVAYDPRKGIAIDRYGRTSNPRIYAAGDVTGGYLFTHAASLQAHTAVRNALFPGRQRFDERVMPWATFTEPEVAHVGLTEAEARQQYGQKITSVKYPFRQVDRAVAEDATDGFIKLISTSRGKLLGAHIVGPAAGESINELALAMQHGLSLAQLARTTHVYPTLALAIQQAAGIYALEQTKQRKVLPLLRRLVR
jgi:pyruvate/2-oxoglutarate dehydrogenase complex dihydrolipoamide dehydrogenase (E3) component